MAILVVALGGLLAACAADDEIDQSADELAHGSNSTFAIIDKGLVRGVDAGGIRAFRGIPYAAAPVGDLRWKAPEAHARWTHVLDATAFANHCPQVGGPFGQDSTSEDCLFLNVYTPSGKRKITDLRSIRDLIGLKPVMVWIHGGALVTGESDDYDATKMVDQGNVIVVTINYRLANLGFLAHPALTAESADGKSSGNWGFMDQQAALKWVHRNILLFGGDPFRVTIFGESAGGLSVHAQLTAASSKGLFHRAIVESGAYALTQPSLAAGETNGTAFAAEVGCTQTDLAAAAACLRAVSVADILANQTSGIGAITAIVDGKFLAQSVGAAFAAGNFSHVPIIAGSNHDEWRLFVALLNELPSDMAIPAAAYQLVISATLGVPAAAAAAIAAQYPLDSFGGSASLAVAALGTDAIFDCNARTAIQRQSKFTTVFAYEFKDPAAPQLFLPPVSFPYAAAHASEIQYLLGVRPNVPAPAFTPDQVKLSDTMISYWTTFARTGQPSSLGTPVWQAFKADKDNFQALDTPKVMAETTFAADHKCAFWAPAPAPTP